MRRKKKKKLNPLSFRSAATVGVASLVLLAGLVVSRANTTHNNPGCTTESAYIMRLYQAFLGRAPDPVGASYWIGQHATNKASIDDIIYSFSHSAEFQEKYANLPSDQFVKAIYQNVLGREPDPGGFTYWTTELNNGAVSQQDFVVLVSDSQEFRNRHPYPVTSFCHFADAHLAGNGYAWTNPHPGVVHGTRKNSNQSINVAYIDLSHSDTSVHVSPGNQKRAVGDYAHDVGGHVAINGNWFTRHGFDGPSISGGHNYGGANHVYTAPFGFSSKNRIYTEKHRDQNELPDWVQSAVSGHPTLTYDRQNVVAGDREVLGDRLNTSRNPRSAIGVSQDEKTLILVTVDGRSVEAQGMTSSELADVMLALGAHRSVMLDGGGSSSMWIREKGIVNRPSDGRPRAVGNQLVIKAGNWVN